MVLWTILLAYLVTGEQFKDDYYCWGDSRQAFSLPCRFFAAILDGGSTGTRLHLYKFVHNSDPNGLPIVVEEETFLEVKPGLSSYNRNPKDAALSVRSLLNKARSVVPHYLWEKTPIALKATAGLRLLPGDLADEIMDHVEEEIFESGFHAITDSVAIMSGVDEGTYSWLTLNLLLDTLYPEPSKSGNVPMPVDTVAAFDLGGGSTQITYWPVDRSIFTNFPEMERHMNFFGNDIKLFTHSFLGNGLVAARLNVLTDNTPDEIENSNELLSACLPEDFILHNWEYSLKNWTVRGTTDYSFNFCYEQVASFVHGSQIMLIKELRGKPIYLFSYFFDRALNSGLVKDNNGGKIRLKDYKKAAVTACSRSSSELDGNHWMPWQCLDITYIYSLLKDGYGFDDEQPLRLVKKIDGMEVAWAQGLSYDLISQFSELQQLDDSKFTNETVVDQLLQYTYHGITNILAFLNVLS